MSKRNIPIFLFLALGLGVSCLTFGTIWLIDQLSSPTFSSVKNPSAPELTDEKLTLLGDTFSGYSTFRNQTFLEALKQAGLNLRYEDEFDQTQRTERFNQGQSDLLVTTLDQFLKQKPQGKIVGLIDTTVGADAVILNTKKYPNLKSMLALRQLVEEARNKGKQFTIVFAGDTPSEYLVQVLTTKFEEFKLSDFQIKKVADASEAWKLLQDSNQNVAVAVLWEPYVSQARHKGYTVVLSSKDLPGTIVDVIVASNRLIESQPEKISQLLTVYYRFIDTNVRNAEQLQAQIALDGKLSSTDASAVLQGIDFFTSVEADNWMKDGTLEKRINSTAAVLALVGKMNQVPQNSKEMFTSQFMAKAAQNTQNLIQQVRIDNPELADRFAGKGKAIAAIPNFNPNQIATAPNIGNLQQQGEVKFTTDSALLTDKGKATLDKLSREIAEFNEQTIAVRVIGHTSKFGEADFNQTLSQKRAQTVANYLRDRGLKHKIVAVGKGSSQPLPGVNPEDKRNQRTEIRLVRIN
ncbi:phosphate ABC transporter substrate-binding/OmpA family protein [Fischerella sp. JS2]|uniref:phosphate ABC transporter substrate-binding/OmpA family protein n=1 Tax=Fischerella sp. JS2 TaxID=2597771 RepID=UPI0028EE2446|nr:phosphate ABC transporter substrate-binding/OmpA family protein [Fischerella sp. JS2]